MPGVIFGVFGCILFLAFILILSSIKTVPQNHIQIVERFGKYSGYLESGLKFITPVFDKVVADIDLALQNLIFAADAVTKDKVVVRIKANLIYSVSKGKIDEYFYNLSNPIETLSSYVENYVRSYVSSQTHEELLERREEISEYLIDHLDEKMLAWGMKISSFQVIDIIFPTELTDAMSKVVASERLKEAATNEAEAQKIKVVKEAEADKESRILLGQGVAGERKAIIDGLKESIGDLTNIEGLDTDEVMNLVVISQYFDTVKEIGESKNTKVLFMNPAPDGAQDLIQSLSSAMEATQTDTGKGSK